MIIRGQKGQSSSVFNLLIAALVSLAILGLLLGIMGGINFGAGNDPVETAVSQLKNAKNATYATKSSVITFSKTAQQIVKETLVEGTDIGDEIYLYTCENTPDRINNDENPNIIQYTGTSDLEATVYAICGSDSSKIDEYFNSCEIKGSFENNDSFACHVIVGPKK
jgi:hypothetical protein